MTRHALIAALVALAPLPLAFAPSAPTIRAMPIALDRGDPARRRVGSLDWLGGWVLKSNDRRFGGISSLTIQDGRFVALSDTGMVTDFRFDGRGQPIDVAMHALPDGPGQAWRKLDRDSESSTFDPATGHVWAGFETSNEIWRYTRNFARADGHVAPPAMADWPLNQGAEAMARLADGRFLVFDEVAGRHGRANDALLFPGDPVDGAVPLRFAVRPPRGYAVTDAAQLPDGRMLVLMRRFALGLGIAGIAPGFAAALAILDPAAIVAGGTITLQPIAVLAPPLAVDNMEALAIERRGGRTIVWIASDDNFLAVQRTLLMAFALRQ